MYEFIYLAIAALIAFSLAVIGWNRDGRDVPIGVLAVFWLPVLVILAVCLIGYAPVWVGRKIPKAATSFKKKKEKKRRQKEEERRKKEDKSWLNS